MITSYNLELAEKAVNEWLKDPDKLENPRITRTLLISIIVSALDEARYHERSIIWNHFMKNFTAEKSE